MPATVVVRGSGGTIYLMDVPTSGHALEAWTEKLAKGELLIIEDEMSVEWFDAGDGSQQLRMVAATEPTGDDEPTEPTGDDEPTEPTGDDEPTEPTAKRSRKRSPKADAPDTAEE